MTRTLVCFLLALLMIAAVVLSGCGKPSLPGSQFETQPSATSTPEPPKSTPLPDKPFQEWGPESAKVRILAFYPIDDPHKNYLNLIKELAHKYPGKIYIKYVDYRTPEGNGMFTRAGASIDCVMINGNTSYEIPGPNGPRTVDFVKDIGRWWTADDLRAAVADAVKKAYGG